MTTRREFFVATLAAASLRAAGPSVQLPRYTRQVLDNGVVLLLLPRQDVPLVTLRAVVRGGESVEPPGKAGVAGLTAELLRRGSRDRTGDQFALELDSLGAVFQEGAGLDELSAEIEYLSKDEDKALPLFLDAVLRPTFPEAEFTKARARAVDSARSVKDNPQAAIRGYFRAAYFGSSHPYGRPADEITLAAVQRDDVTGFHSRWFTGRNLIVVAAGRFDPASLTPKLTAAFRELPRGEATVPAAEPPAPSRGGPQMVLIDKPDATQTYFLLAQPGSRRTNPDRVPLQLVNILFGGRFTSMLNDELRVNSGLTYGANSLLPQNRLTSYQAITTYTQTATTEKTIDLALEVRRRLIANGITAEALTSAKAYLKGTFPADELETGSQLASLLTELELYGLDRAEIDQLFAKVDAVTVEQANAVARRYYGSDRLLFVLLGNAAAIRAGVKKYAPALVEVPITRPGLRL